MRGERCARVGPPAWPAIGVWAALAMAACGPNLKMRRPDLRIDLARLTAVPAIVTVFELDDYGKVSVNTDWTEVGAKNVDLAIDRMTDAAGASTCDANFLKHADPDYAVFRRWAAEALLEISEQLRGRVDYERHAVWEWQYPEKGLPAWRRILEADYVLVVLYRNGRETTARALSNILGGVAVVPVQTAIACVIDLADGRIAWCNQRKPASLDLTSPAGATTSVRWLLDEVLPSTQRRSPAANAPPR